MSNYKEIVTKAVIGKGKKYFKNKYSVKSEVVPSTILGCWIINHKFKGYVQGDDVVVDGSFDINIWYSYDNDTKTNVINETIKYNELINVKTKLDVDFNDSEIIVRVLKQPSCGNVQINGNTIDFDIEKELGIEVVNDEKVKIAIEEDEEPWDVIGDDEYTEEVDNEIDKIKKDYIEKREE